MTSVVFWVISLTQRTVSIQVLVGGELFSRTYGMAQDAHAVESLRRGLDCDFEKTPNRHRLYHCFFDFDGPPPAADAIIYGNVGGTGRRIV